MNTFSKKPPMKNKFTDYPAPPDRINNEDVSKLYSLIGQGNFGAVIDFLLEATIDLNVPFEEKIILNEVINIPDEKASEDKKLEFLEYLTENRQVFINAYDEHGVSPLHCAVKHGYEKIIDFLLSKKINIDSQTENNLTPLHYATLITLKDCPKENAPLSLVSRDKTEKTKTNEITKLLIKTIFDHKKNNVNDMEVVTPGAPNTDAVLYEKFINNTNTLNKIYSEITQGILTDFNIKDEIVKLQHGNPNILLEKDYIKDFANDMMKKLGEKIKFPLDAMSTVKEKIEDHVIENYDTDVSQNALFKDKIQNIIDEIKSSMGHWPGYIIHIDTMDIINNDDATIMNTIRYNFFIGPGTVWIDPQFTQNIIRTHNTGILNIFNKHIKEYVQDIYLYKYMKKPDLVIKDASIIYDWKDLLDNTNPINISDYIDQDFINLLVAYHYDETIMKYKFKDNLYNGAKELLDLKSDPFKKAIIDDHIRGTYEQFYITYMSKQLQNIFIDQINKQISNAALGATPPLTKIFTEPEDYNIDVNSVKSQLKDYIKNGTAYIDNHSNVKLIEDENFDIFTVEEDKITESGDKDTYIFYSYDYYNKQTEMKCIEINVDIIEKLLNNNANIYATDMNNKTVIDYMIEGRMYYLLKPNSSIVKSCLMNQSILTLVTYEQRHNSLFKKVSDTNKSSYPLLQNHQTDFINNLKLSENIKLNIPINLRYIFNVYTVLQNIHWYRLLNKELHNDTSYKDIYVKYYGPVAKKQLLDEYNWKQFFNVNIKVDKINKKEKEKMLKIIERTNKPIYDNDKPLDFYQKRRLDQMMVDSADSDGKNMSDNNIAKGNMLIPNPDKLNYDVLATTENKLFAYFTQLFNKYDDIPTNYTYIWSTMKDTILSEKFMIHRVLMDEYNDKIKKVKDSRGTGNILSGHEVTLDETLVDDLLLTCKKLEPIVNHISKYIDDRVLPQIYTQNRLLQFQIQAIVHILSTFLGSNIFMLYKRIIEVEIKKTSNDTINDTDLNKILEPLKHYVLSTEIKKGNLSYDFIKAHMRFMSDDEDKDDEPLTNGFFIELPNKLDQVLLTKFGIADSKLMEKLKSSVASYYLSLYQETVNALLNFSDGYYRFTKNQILGIKFAANLN
jgi:hypothetical protein